MFYDDDQPLIGSIPNTVIFGSVEKEPMSIDVFLAELDAMLPTDNLTISVDDMDHNLRMILDPGFERKSGDSISFTVEGNGSFNTEWASEFILPNQGALIGAGGGTVEKGNPKDAVASSKPDLSLNPSSALLYMALGFEDGAKKYGAFNWREYPVRTRVYIAAALRHIEQYLDGEDIDPVSSKPHIAHALASLAIIADATENNMLIDDRPLPGRAGQFIRNYEEAKKRELV